MKQCPRCHEEIIETAAACRFCNEWFTTCPACGRETGASFDRCHLCDRPMPITPAVRSTKTAVVKRQGYSASTLAGTNTMHLHLHKHKQSNPMGVAAFVVSLVGIIGYPLGFVSCGLGFVLCILCPIGLLLAIGGMLKPPRGMATAGLVLGLIGAIPAIVFMVLFGIGAIAQAIGNK